MSPPGLRSADGAPSPPEELLDDARGSRRTTWILVAALALALIAGGLVMHQRSTGDTPESVVRDYLALIADGRIDEATTLVPPDRWSGYRGARDRPTDRSSVALMPSLLTTATVTGQDARIEVTEIAANQPGDDGLIPVQVRYRLDDSDNRAVLRVRPVATAVYRPQRFEVVDPLLVPLTVTSATARLGGYTLHGQRIPLTPLSQEPTGISSILLYPGRYLIEPPQVSYAQARPQAVWVSHSRALSASGVVRARADSLGPSRPLMASMLAYGQRFLTRCSTDRTPDDQCPPPTQPDRSPGERPDLGPSAVMGGATLDESDGQVTATMLIRSAEDETDTLLVVHAEDLAADPPTLSALAPY